MLEPLELEIGPGVGNGELEGTTTTPTGVASMGKTTGVEEGWPPEGPAVGLVPFRVMLKARAMRWKKPEKLGAW